MSKNDVDKEKKKKQKTELQHEALEKKIVGLTPREIKVLRMRFGDDLWNTEKTDKVSHA